MEWLLQFGEWLSDGYRRFAPDNLPLPTALWRFLADHIGNLPLVVAFLVMLYFAMGLATRAARASDIRAFGKLILSIGVAGAVLLLGYFVVQTQASAPAPVADKAHFTEMARRLGTHLSEPHSASFAEGMADQFSRYYFFLLPCLVMVLVGGIILVMFKPKDAGTPNRF